MHRHNRKEHVLGAFTREQGVCVARSHVAVGGRCQSRFRHEQSGRELALRSQLCSGALLAARGARGHGGSRAFAPGCEEHAASVLASGLGRLSAAPPQLQVQVHPLTEGREPRVRVVVEGGCNTAPGWRRATAPARDRGKQTGRAGRKWEAQSTGRGTSRKDTQAMGAKSSASKRHTGG